MISSYPYKISCDRKKFDFTSVGHNGQINKLIEFYPVHEKIHQLGLSDFNAKGEPDLALPPTNNGDVFRVMTTIIETMVRFFEDYPDQWVLIRGASPKHLRLYQRVLTTQVPAKESRYLFYGIQANQHYGPYHPEVDYESIMVAKRLTPID